MPKFDRPDELGAEEAADNTDERGVGAIGRQAAADKLTMKHPQSRHCAQRNEHAERRHFEVAEPEQDRVHPGRGLLASRLREVDRELPHRKARLPECCGLRDRAIDVPSIDRQPLDQPHRRGAVAAAAVNEGRSAPGDVIAFRNCSAAAGSGEPSKGT